MASFRFTKLKITAGYTLLLAILLFSLVFVHREMEALSAADDQQNLRTDSLLTLLHEKDQNTIQMLRVLSEANDSLLSASEIEEIISEQDSVITQQRVQHRVITKRDSLITTPKKKGFFKRLAEVFSPSKQDSAVLINTSLEVATDTILQPTTSKDSLQQKIRMATEEKRLQRRRTIRRTSTKYQRMNTQLTARMDSLIKQYEGEMTLRARQDAELQQEVRMRSARIIGGIAVGAVLLSAFFLILIMRDISRSNRYRQQLEVANKRAEDLLVAREKLMLAITHDFKAPLGSIMGYTELLSRLTEDERQRFYLDNMKSSSEHLLKLVSDLLDFHRLDLNKAEVNRVTFNPSQLFDEIYVSFEPLTAAKGLALQCHVAPELNGRYISDPLRLRQIVNNLLSNAVKFTQKGEISLTAGYDSSKLTIAIADTGKGMALEDRERIFQEFTRLSGAQGEEGFGLGLSIVKKLVTLLEGTIDVQSTLGKGSCFTVTLPLYPVGKSIAESESTESENADITEESAVIPPMKVIRVLLIDDDKIQLNLTAAMLKQHGIDAVCCEQLEQLVEQLRSSVFDVLLTDIQMPAINGFDLVKLLRASNIPQAKTIPVIAVTARSEMDKAALHEHGFAGCLHKPFTVKELLMTVNEGQLSADEAHITEDMATAGINFSALTAYSEDDPEAASSIIQTFIEETGKNIERMQQALNDKEVDGIAAMAHKLLPLFTMIGVDEAIPLLEWLEVQRGQDFSKKVKEKTDHVLQEILIVLTKAREYEQYLLQK
ncbi:MULTISPECIES: hybrid sensor histidine kinase/response regulator [Bacteroides]|uniref:histidine kinase n=1 Tax=Bacteroides xylanisolvens SD CC 1b TaxID=702447 RepID=D4VMS7_9BACE|nr:MULTISPECIES: ATP-binding protein [Bacteroides]CDL98442.1 Two-component system sensor histidine kinase [Bacteroides xylanisolvens SD CC 2a]EEO50315.1 ATPase/histidine kinase/DNA gyrase B/HSP90 domain protein [Bacteroides sp. D1]EEZ05025.1 ATPase/histidine kinase/DNA gyrase B/HSP90 domain protein [Bacteroides sp. 2_1_22]EFG12866.1 ATPase/histidine kinase/DNA gyrase B/HSP90 domain protein [Bacteroides xylanisolvens SD CC 1b]CDM07067.1 Two-component system sensor histidine kinase [Bacteroides 